MIDAHGIGGQSDLPIPLSMAAIGAVAALVVSFAVLILAWRSPRFEGAQRAAGTHLPQVVSTALLHPVTAAVLRSIGMALFLYTAACAWLGQDQLTNPFFGIVYIWWWVGLVFASVLLGPVWKAISPIRTLHGVIARLAGTDAEHGLRRYPKWLGYWPAAVGLFSFVWLELVYDRSDELADVRLWCAIYLAIMIVGGAVFGATFYERADPFEVYSTLVSRLSPWRVTPGADGAGQRIYARNPLANLASTPPLPGLVAVVGVLFGSTGYDSFSDSPFWIRTVYDSSFTANTLNNVALIVFCVGTGALFAVGSALTPSGGLRARPELPRLMAHSIVPIIAGYIVAHYLTLFVDYGVLTLARASDPFGHGWNILGTADLAPTYWFSYHPTLLASIKVLAVVLGHVAAAVVAHDRALSVLPERHQIVEQVPLLITMVGFTAGGLLLLFSS